MTRLIQPAANYIWIIPFGAAGTVSTAKFFLMPRTTPPGRAGLRSSSATAACSLMAGGQVSIAQRVQRYILEGSDGELRRLLSLSEVTAGPARQAFSRAGLSQGWAAIDCGCGPIGGLAVLAEMVGPAGRVVGVDISEPAVRRARSAAAALGLGNIDVVAGDIHRPECVYDDSPPCKL